MYQVGLSVYSWILNALTSSVKVNIIFASQLIETVKSVFPPGRRSGWKTGVQHHLIPHQPQRKQGGERLWTSKLSSTVSLSFYLPLPHSCPLSSVLLPLSVSVFHFIPPFFLCLHYTLPARLLGLWGVTLQESGCNNMAVICLDLIWSQSSWESERDMCGEVDKERQGEWKRKTDVG